MGLNKTAFFSQDTSWWAEIKKTPIKAKIMTFVLSHSVGCFVQNTWTEFRSSLGESCSL